MNIPQARETVHEYQHAIVIGASIAGLLAARVLSDHFERVTIIERDHLPQHIQNRKGVPQGRYVHLLLAKCSTLLEEFFPGFGKKLLDHGSKLIDSSADMRLYQYGAWRNRIPCGIGIDLQSRPLLEYVLLEYIRAHSRIDLLEGCQVTSVCGDTRGTCVTEVAFQHRDGKRPQS